MCFFGTPSSTLSARAVKPAAQVSRLRNHLRPHGSRNSPGSPDPGYKRSHLPVSIGVRAWLKTQSASKLHHDQVGAEQRTGKAVQGAPSSSIRRSRGYTGCLSSGKTVTIFVEKRVRCSRGRLPASGGPPSDRRKLFPPIPPHRHSSLPARRSLNVTSVAAEPRWVFWWSSTRSYSAGRHHRDCFTRKKCSLEHYE